MWNKIAQLFFITLVSLNGFSISWVNHYCSIENSYSSQFLFTENACEGEVDDCCSHKKEKSKNPYFSENCCTETQFSLETEELSLNKISIVLLPLNEIEFTTNKLTIRNFNFERKTYFISIRKAPPLIKNALTVAQKNCIWRI